ncbi:hypothetical protein BZG36_02202 [Bifiguratus adelaidae]|uniref:C3H1-type domain-containing protein n=1 Tax=Bifiguratus adelaidae TaxID=1938954 RepID=A0A261Y3K6_9FUNG|nr:hypothetical protein BZG36_02202 [Bifiguratus adelaidae]
MFEQPAVVPRKSILFLSSDTIASASAQRHMHLMHERIPSPLPHIPAKPTQKYLQPSFARSTASFGEDIYQETDIGSPCPYSDEELAFWVDKLTSCPADDEISWSLQTSRQVRPAQMKTGMEHPAESITIPTLPTRRWSDPIPGQSTRLHKPELVKTELCHAFETGQPCPYGIRCFYAHGKDELRPIIRSPQYKTKMCRSFILWGHCPYGHKCLFRHGINDVPMLEQSSPTSSLSSSLQSLP